MSVTGRIDALIKEQGISRRELAKRAGIPPTTLQTAMEKGKIPKRETLEKIAEVLGVSPDYLSGKIDFITYEKALESRFHVQIPGNMQSDYPTREMVAAGAYEIRSDDEDEYHSEDETKYRLYHLPKIINRYQNQENSFLFSRDEMVDDISMLSEILTFDRLENLHQKAIQLAIQDYEESQNGINQTEDN